MCTIAVFSLGHPVRFFAEMKYMINKWEGPCSWLITTLRNTVICNSLNALFSIYIYWKLILYVLVLSQWQITGKYIIKRELNSNLSSFLLEIILQLSCGPSSPFQWIPLCHCPQLFSLIYEFLSSRPCHIVRRPKFKFWLGHWLRDFGQRVNSIPTSVFSSLKLEW